MIDGPDKKFAAAKNAAAFFFSGILRPNRMWAGNEPPDEITEI
jgi:hypothetical protein